MNALSARVEQLPENLAREVEDFIDFLEIKYSHSEKKGWSEISEQSLEKIWANDDDDIYAELLKK